MNDEQFKALTAQTNAEQHLAEINATAGVTALYFRVLLSNGIPEVAAARMAEAYNAMMILQHFGAENHGGYMNFLMGGADEGMDDDD